MLTELRRVINDDTSYPEWPEDTLISFLAEGQDKFCEDTGYFRDSSSFSITLDAGVAVYDVPDRIIEILSIWNGHKKLTKIDTGTDFEDQEIDWSITTGIPTQWKLDDDTGSIVFYPTPSTDADNVVLTIKAWRYSLVDLAASTGEPEIPARYQRACIEWAAFKALSFHDAETQDPVKAEEHEDNFKRYVHDGLIAFRRSHGIEMRVGCDPAYRV